MTELTAAQLLNALISVNKVANRQPIKASDLPGFDAFTTATELETQLTKLVEKHVKDDGDADLNDKVLAEIYEVLLERFPNKLVPKSEYSCIKELIDHAKELLPKRKVYWIEHRGQAVLFSGVTLSRAVSVFQVLGKDGRWMPNDFRSAFKGLEQTYAVAIAYNVINKYIEGNDANAANAVEVMVKTLREALKNVDADMRERLRTTSTSVQRHPGRAGRVLNAVEADESDDEAVALAASIQELSLPAQPSAVATKGCTFHNDKAKHAVHDCFILAAMLARGASSMKEVQKAREFLKQFGASEATLKEFDNTSSSRKLQPTAGFQ
ncbi:hypothetical protein GQ42DRAFT_8313 [Ramicandelaber brevisporus]|nr:hypothetical protein GQ42DRAFT_8313 [Ramicandelaber brevisporus]